MDPAEGAGIRLGTGIGLDAAVGLGTEVWVVGPPVMLMIEQSSDSKSMYAIFALLAVRMKVSHAVLVTEGIPVMDAIWQYNYIERFGARMIGPNCPGIVTAGQCKVGIMPGAHLHARPRRGDQPLGHADLRGGQRADRGRAGADDLHRHRRRSRDRLALHRPADRLRRRSRRRSASW